MKIDLVILASGFARRFGSNKLLYNFQGKPLLQHTIEKALTLDFSSIHIVTQYADVLTMALAYGIDAIYNHHPEKGISESIKCGIFASQDSDGIMFLVGDQPRIRVKTLRQMCECADDQHIICAYHQGVIHNPLLFPRCYNEQLLSLQGEQGGKKIALMHRDKCKFVDVMEQEISDIDTVGDLYK